MVGRCVLAADLQQTAACILAAVIRMCAAQQMGDEVVWSGLGSHTSLQAAQVALSLQHTALPAVLQYCSLTFRKTLATAGRGLCRAPQPPARGWPG